MEFITLLDAATAANADAAASSSLFSLVFMIILLVAFYFLLIRPQKKKEKKDAEMRKNLQIGDEIVTAGGIVGIVCKVEEQTIVIETTGDRSKFRVQKWAISQNLTATEDAKIAAEKKSDEKNVGIEK